MIGGPLRIVFMGTPQDAALALEGLIHKKNPPIAVVTQKDRPRGRGLRVEPTPVKRVASAHRIPVFEPDSWRDPKSVEWLRQQNADLVLIAAYGHILPKEILGISKLGFFNIHASLLPKYRGPEPVRAALLAGEQETGVTIFRLEEGVDTGPVVLQARVAITPEDDAGSLTQKIFHKGVEILPRFIAIAKSGNISTTPQDHTLASHSRKFVNTEAEIDWRKSAVEISNHVRAFSPEPGSFTGWKRKRLKIFRAVGEGSATHSKGGVAVQIEKNKGIGVTTGRGMLWVQELQLEGRKRLTAEEFLRGTRDFTPPQVLGVTG